jgi:hypothetical protein
MSLPYHLMSESGVSSFIAVVLCDVRRTASFITAVFRLSADLLRNDISATDTTKQIAAYVALLTSVNTGAVVRTHRNTFTTSLSS